MSHQSPYKKCVKRNLLAYLKPRNVKIGTGKEITVAIAQNGKVKNKEAIFLEAKKKLNEFTHETVLDSYFEPLRHPDSIVLEIEDINIGTIVNNMENKKMQEMEARIKASLESQDAKYAKQFAYLTEQINELTEKNIVFTEQINELRELGSSTAETTILNVSGEIMLFCFHEQPQKKPKTTNKKNYHVNSEKLKRTAILNIEKMKEKFGKRFVQDSEDIIEYRNNCVHFSSINHLIHKVNECYIAFKVFPELCTKYSLQKKYIDEFDWFLKNLVFKS